jgi:hypothetical protein
MQITRNILWYAGAWRTEEGIKKKKLQDRENKRKKLATDPKFREKLNLARRALRLKKREYELERGRAYHGKHREVRNAKRVAWAKANKERQLATQRDGYRRNKTKRLANIYEGRDRRNPDRVIRRLIGEFRSGRLSLSEFVKEVSKQANGYNASLCERDGLREGERIDSKP